MLKNISPAMQDAIEGMKAHGYLVADHNDRTMVALQRRGLARWCPYAKRDCFQGIWKLTAEGRVYQ